MPAILKVEYEHDFLGTRYSTSKQLILPKIQIISPKKEQVLEPGDIVKFSFYLNHPCYTFNVVKRYYKIENGSYCELGDIVNYGLVNPWNCSREDWNVPNQFSLQDTFIYKFIDSKNNIWTVLYPFKIWTKKPSNFYALPLQEPYRIKLTWTKNSNIAIGYEIRKEWGNGSQMIITIPDANTTSYIDNAVDPGTLYKYYIRAYDNAGHYSDWEGPIYPDHTPPVVNIISPKNLTIIRSGSNVHILWSIEDHSPIILQQITWPCNQYVNLIGDIRDTSLTFTYCPQYSSRGGEYPFKIFAIDKAWNIGVDSIKVVVYDPSKINMELSYNLTSSQVLLHSSLPFDRLYSRRTGFFIDKNGHISNYDTGWFIEYYGDNITDYSDDGLSNFETVYYFATRCRYHNPKWFLDISNILSLSSSIPYCPLLYVNTDSGFVLDNSLLPRSEHISEPYTDYYKLSKVPSSDSIIKIMIYSKDDITYLDNVKLLKVEHPKGKEIGILQTGEIICYQRTNAKYRAVDNNNKDWADSLRRKDGKSWKGKKTDWLIVDPRPENTGHILITLRPPKEIGMIALSYVYTRAIEEEQVIFYPESLIKIIPVESLEIDYLTLIRKMPENMMDIDTLIPNNIPSEMISLDSIYYMIKPDEKIEISFKKGDVHPGKDIDYVMIVNGYYEKRGEEVSKKSIASLPIEKIIVSSIGPCIKISFENSIEKDGEIEIFNIAGMRVKIMKVHFKKGLNELEIKDIPSGVYFVKISKKVFKTTIIR